MLCSSNGSSLPTVRLRTPDRMAFVTTFTGDEDTRRRRGHSASCPAENLNKPTVDGGTAVCSSLTTPKSPIGLPTPTTNTSSTPATDVSPTPPTCMSPTSPPEVPAPNPPNPDRTPITTSVAEVTPCPTSQEGISSLAARPPSLDAPPLVTPSPTLVPPPRIQTAPFEHDPSHPTFITAAAIEHLNSVGGGESWVEMVRLYLELERNYRSRVSRSFP